MARTEQVSKEARTSAGGGETGSRPVILEKLTAELERVVDAAGENLRVEDARIGVFYTGVKLNTGHAGVAYTPVHEIPQSRCCPLSRGRISTAGELRQHSVKEFLSFAFSPHLLERAVGIAAINAVSQMALEQSRPGYQLLRDVETLDFLQARPQDVVAIVGAFPPVIRALKDVVKKIYVLEKNPKAQVDVELQPEEASVEILPKADLLVLTGATIVNHSFEGLIKLATSARQILILGPTASMIPGPLFAHGVTLLGGIRFYDPDAMLRIVGEAGSGSHFYESCGAKTTIIPVGKEAIAGVTNAKEDGQDQRSGCLRIDGLVAEPLDLQLEDLQNLPQSSLGEWQGVKLSAILATARPLTEARYITLHSGADATSLEMGKADNAGILLAYGSDGMLLSRERGGPIRLVAPEADCFQNLKWIERVELTRERNDSLAERMSWGSADWEG